MRKAFLGGLFAGLTLLGGSFAIAAEIESGPQVGKSPAPFHPTNVTGPNAGEKHCLVCSNGSNPVAMVFAREVSPNLTTLIKKIDAATAKNSGCEMGSFVVFLNDEESLEKKLKELATKEGIKTTVLAVDNPAGPQGYKIAKEADVTVVLYTKRKVQVNYAFGKGELKESDVEKIVADISKIVPKN